MNHIRTIVWDWNGTLVDDSWLIHDAFNALLSHHDLTPITFEHHRDIARHPVRHTYQVAGLEVTDEEFSRLCNVFEDHYSGNKHRVCLHTDAIKTVQSFKNKGLRQFILSAASKEHLVAAAHGFEIASYFDDIFAHPNSYGHGKEDLAKELFARHGLHPETTLIIGDTDHDAEVAKHVNAQCILIDRGINSRMRLEKTGARVISNFKELTELFS